MTPIVSNEFEDPSITTGRYGHEYGLAELREKPGTFGLVIIDGEAQRTVDTTLRVTLSWDRRNEELCPMWDARLLELLLEHLENNWCKPGER